MQVNILVEGQTEEMFVKELLQPYLSDNNLIVTPIIISTKRLRNGIKFKGGLSGYHPFKSDLQKVIHSTPHGIVTTLIDYYGLPDSFPKYADRVHVHSQRGRVEFLEEELWKDLGEPKNFIPHIQLHEFETLLFSSKAGFEGNIEASNPALNGLCGIVDHYANPEDINEGVATAPSKRLLHNYPSYEKVWEGNLIANEIGVDVIKGRCPHFSDWIDKIKAYS